MDMNKTENKIYIVGMGPGAEDMMTGQAIKALEVSDIIIGYTVYIQLLGEKFQNKELLSTPMRKEKERCKLCFEKAQEGKTVAMVCSGDAGIYGLASLMYEIGTDDPDVALEVIPGIPAANSGAAVLGAPLNHDFCTISLSDLLTPWETIEKRLLAAAEGDFVIALYNPSSHKRHDYLKKACELMLQHKSPETVCGTVQNINREGETARVMTLAELKETQVDMFTTVFIGNSQTRNIDGKMVTPRGYKNV